jgi:hypothetical protein
MFDGEKHSCNCDSHYNRMHGYYLNSADNFQGRLLKEKNNTEIRSAVLEIRIVFWDVLPCKIIGTIPDDGGSAYL